MVVLAVSAQAVSDKERESKIAATQGGATELFFNPMAANIPVIVPGSFYEEKECTVRNGIPGFFTKIKSGKAITVGYIGGSITQGMYCYRTQSAKYLQTLFPKVDIKFINAGVSGTGTDLGACRMEEQLLKYEPDLIFIEFAVNGAYAPGMEGMIRQARQRHPATEICLIYTVFTGQTQAYAEGRIPENIAGLEKLAEHYKIPSVHLAMEAAQLEKEGRLVWKGDTAATPDKIVFSADGIHPVVAGGNLYAAALARAMQKMQKAKPSPAAAVLPAALYASDWEKAGMYAPEEVATFSGGWLNVNTVTIPKLKPFAGWFPSIKKTDKPGSSYTFRFKGTMFGIFDIGGPEAGQLQFELDGQKVRLQEISSKGYHLFKAVADTAKGVELINRFNNYCNNRYRGQYEFIETTPGEHTVTVFLSPEKADKRKILGERQLADITANPDKYDRTVLYLGKILLRGEIIPVQRALTQQEKWEQKVLAYERKDSLNPPAANGILFTGSSTIENWKTIQADLPGKYIISRGISGTKINDLLKYADRVITPYKAKQIFLYEGDNDIGFKRTPEEILHDFTALFNKVRSDNKKAEIVFISIKPSPSRFKDSVVTERANSLIRDFIEQQKNAAYADVYYPMLTSDKKLVPAYYREDGLHLTAEGYQVWTAVIRKFIK
jgi:lysophospholipase L1-like esterase